MVIIATLPSCSDHKTQIEMLAHGLTLCLFFLSRSQLSRGTNSSLRTRLIGEMGTGSFGPGWRKRVAEDGERHGIDRQAIEGQGGSVVDFVQRNRARYEGMKQR